jgi:hypothetical protein
MVEEMIDDELRIKSIDVFLGWKWWAIMIRRSAAVKKKHGIMVKVNV